MSLLEFARQAAESGRKVFGADHDLMIARCPAWGGDDVCIIVRGAGHALAAAAFLKVAPAARITEQHAFAWGDRPAYTYSTVEFNFSEETFA